MAGIASTPGYAWSRAFTENADGTDDALLLLMDDSVIHAPAGTVRAWCDHNCIQVRAIDKMHWFDATPEQCSELLEFIIAIKEQKDFQND